MFLAVIFAWPSALSDRPPTPWWLSPGEDGMPLRDAVGINCKKGGTSECQVYGCSLVKGQDVKYIYGLRGCMLMIMCVLSDFRWLPLLGGGRKSWHIIFTRLLTWCNRWMVSLVETICYVCDNKNHWVIY